MLRSRGTKPALSRIILLPLDLLEALAQRLADAQDVGGGVRVEEEDLLDLGRAVGEVEEEAVVLGLKGSVRMERTSKRYGRDRRRKKEHHVASEVRKAELHVQGLGLVVVELKALGFQCQPAALLVGQRVGVRLIDDHHGAAENELLVAWAA